MVTTVKFEVGGQYNPTYSATYKPRRANTWVISLVYMGADLYTTVSLLMGCKWVINRITSNGRL